MISKNLVLVSQSPRRRELMALLRVPFKTASPVGDEILDASVSVYEQIECIARDKALSVLPDYKDSVLVGADTVIVFNGEILGKPKDEADAIRMLTLLSNQTHEVITGVCIATKDQQEVFSVKSKVKFYPLTEAEILDYVATKEPLDRAGAYSIQGGAALFIEHVDGDHFAIMGLPIGRVYQSLMKKEW